MRFYLQSFPSYLVMLEAKKTHLALPPKALCCECSTG